MENRGLHVCPENYVNQERFWPKQNEAERQRGFIEKPFSHPCVSVFQSFPTLSYSTHMYISGNEENQEKKQIIFLFISDVILLPSIRQKYFRSTYSIVNPFKSSYYKNLFLRKNQTDHVWTWFGQSGKRRSNARQYGTKKLPPSFLSGITIQTLCTISATKLMARKT